jgi:hypothetical protein
MHPSATCELTHSACIFIKSVSHTAVNRRRLLNPLRASVFIHAPTDLLSPISETQSVKVPIEHIEVAGVNGRLNELPARVAPRSRPLIKF